MQVQDAIVWRGFCAIRRGFQVFYLINVRRSKKCETFSSFRSNSVCAWCRINEKSTVRVLFSGSSFALKLNRKYWRDRAALYPV
ncbi:hypothetical protein CDR68_13175 [Salmonella enterica]|nr:hypothetical protein [Salmonella enterica]